MFGERTFSGNGSCTGCQNQGTQAADSSRHAKSLASRMLRSGVARPVGEILHHLGQVSVIFLATWALKRVLFLKRTKDGHFSADEEDLSQSVNAYRLLASPESQFRPATPEWLKKQAELAVSGIPQGAEVPQPPQVLEALERLRTSGEKVELGSQSILEDFFLLKRDVAQHFLNAGSFGAVYRLVADAQKWYQDLVEQEPVLFHEELGPLALQAAKASVAEYIKAAEADTVHVVNATAAVNTVLHSLRLRQGDLLLITSITYAAVRNAVARYAAQAHAGVVEVVLDLETLQRGTTAVIERFSSVLSHLGGRVRLAVLDHVTSAPTVHLPIVELSAACKRHGAKVLVDGAHAMGAIPLDVPALGVHFYTSNLHKWGCCPKSAAFLWVERQEQAGLVPLVTSHGYKQGFQGEFAWPGTTDVSAWLAAPVALQVQQALGSERVRSHNNQKLREAVELLLEAWGRQLAVLGADAPNSHMASLELPRLRDFPVRASRSAEKLHVHLRERYGIQLPVSFWEGRLWARISSQIFNTAADYRALRDAIIELLD